MQKIPGVSLYHQIKQDLRTKIEPLDPGTKIETEQQLSEFYGVSRGTIRQAISDLVGEGLLQKVQGSGTFRSSNDGVHIAQYLKIAAGTEVYRLSRVRLANGIPFGVGTAYIRRDVVPQLKAEDLEMSLVDMMETKYGFSFTNRHGYCYAVPASAELAAALSVRTNSPVLKIDYIFCDRNGMPLMVDMMQLSGSFRLALDAAENITG